MVKESENTQQSKAKEDTVNRDVDPPKVQMVLNSVKPAKTNKVILNEKKKSKE